MSLYVAVAAEGAHGPSSQQAAWGAWGVHPVSEVTSLALAPEVVTGRAHKILVLVPPRLAPLAHRMASAVASTRPSIAVRVEAPKASLTALVQAVTLSATVRGSLNGAHASIRQTLEQTAWGAWLPSVARLSNPAPSLVQHVQSWLPGGQGYLAMAQPRGWVARLPLSPADVADVSHRLSLSSALPANGDSGDVVRQARTPRGEIQCVTDGDLPEAAIAALFALGADRRPLRREVRDDPKAAWGSKGAVEFAVSPGAPSDPGAPTGRCPTCAEALWGPACPFCRVRAPETPTDHPLTASPLTDSPLTDSQGVSA